MSMPRAVCLLGPTAAGKSSAALALAHHLERRGQRCELISVDSAQVYRGMDIGTAKPTRDERAAVPHHLIDICEPTEGYSAGHFVRDAAELITELNTRGCLPLLTGGTMLYFQALQRGLAPLPEADASLRDQLDERGARLGWPALHAELAQVDPVSAARLRPTDAQRIQRALEVFALASVPLSELQRETAPGLAADYLNIGLIPGDRGVLHARIAQRFANMLAAGLVEEVAGLLQRPGVRRSTPALRAVGYRQMLPHVLDNQPLDIAAGNALTATRRLAKRQLTWLRSWPDLTSVDSLVADTRHTVLTKVVDWLDCQP